MKIELTGTRIINWICMLLILAMVAMLFTPYWTYTTKEKNEETGKREEVTKEISINDYVWFPRDHKEMTKEFDKIYDKINEDNGAENEEDMVEFWINDLVLMPVLVLALGLILGIISLWYSKSPFTSALALGLGGLGTFSYITRPEFGFTGPLPEFAESVIGNPMLHIIISAVTAAVGAAGIIWFVVQTALEKKKK